MDHLTAPQDAVLQPSPRLRAGITLHRMDVGRRAETWIIRTPEGRCFLAGAREVAFLSGLAGARSLADLVAHPGSAPEGRADNAEGFCPVAGAPVPEKDRLHAAQRFIESLAAKGLLEGSVGPHTLSAATGWRAMLGDPTPLLKPVCALIGRLPRGALAPAVASLIVAGSLAALGQSGSLSALFSPHVLWGRLPAGVLAAWAMGIWHELAHATSAVIWGARVGGIGVALVGGWRPVFYVDLPDLLLLPRRGRVAIAAAGPLADALLASVATVAARLVPAATGPALAVAAVALARLVWNIVPAMRTDGAYLVSEAAGVPDLERRARRAVGAWFSLVLGRRDRDRTRAAGAWLTRHGGIAIVLYGLFSVGLEAAVMLIMLLRIASGLAAR